MREKRDLVRICLRKKERREVKRSFETKNVHERRKMEEVKAARIEKKKNGKEQKNYLVSIVSL